MQTMLNRLRTWTTGVRPSFVVAAITIGVVLIALGRLSASGEPSQRVTVIAATPTPTRVLPTPTPRLIIDTPQVIADYLTSIATLQGPPCDACNTLHFTAGGPFYLIVSCQPFGEFGDVLPGYEVRLFDGNGHLLDTIVNSCGDPNGATVTTAVNAELRAAGAYRLDVFATAPVSVLVLDASASSGA